MKNLLYFTYLCILPILLPAQEYTGGLDFEDETYDQLARQATYAGIKNNLPSVVDLSPYCPEVRNQGGIYSCVGWAVGYGALSIKKAIHHNWTDKKQITANAYSALFIYNQIKQGHCGQGSRLSDAMEFVKNQGDCLAQEFDFDIEDCQKNPTENLKIKAIKDTVADYLTLFGSNEDPGQKVHKVKAALAQQHPVIIGLAVRQNFYQLQKASYWWPELGRTTPAGGHALVVVGYDDPSQSFLLFNSWGKNWGDQGYIRVKYKDFGIFCKYAYILNEQEDAFQLPGGPDDSPMNETIPLRQWSGKATLKHFKGYSDVSQEAIFSPSSVEGNRGLYHLKGDQWEVGQLFQLAATNPERDLYLYVFSIDPLNNLHIHWPRQETLNQQYRDLNESAWIPMPGAQLDIPGKFKALKLALPGKEHLYLLFSTKKIRHLRFICEKMRYAKATPLNQLKKVLGDHLVPEADIDYQNNQVAFEVSSRSKGYIVPLILEINTTTSGPVD